MGKNFKLNLPGLNAIMKSAEMRALIDKAANQMKDAAGPGYEVEVAHPISFVGIGSVRAETTKAKLENSRNNTLLKAAGRVKI